MLEKYSGFIRIETKSSRDLNPLEHNCRQIKERTNSRSWFQFLFPNSHSLICIVFETELYTKFSNVYLVVYKHYLICLWWYTWSQFQFEDFCFPYLESNIEDCLWDQLYMAWTCFFRPEISKFKIQKQDAFEFIA